MHRGVCSRPCILNWQLNSDFELQSYIAENNNKKLNWWVQHDWWNKVIISLECRHLMDSCSKNSTPFDRSNQVPYFIRNKHALWSLLHTCILDHECMCSQIFGRKKKEERFSHYQYLNVVEDNVLKNSHELM